MKKVLAFWLLALGCNQASMPGVATASWSAAQQSEYKSTCERVAGDMYNTKLLVDFRGVLDLKPACACSLASVMRLYPSYGHWQVAADTAKKNGGDYLRYADYGPYAMACNKGNTYADAAFVNWCAELGRCAKPADQEAEKRKGLPSGE